MLLAIEIDGLDQEIFKGALAAALSSKPKRDDEKKDNLDIIKIIAEKRSELGVDSLYEDLETAKTLGRKDCEEFFKELIAAAGAEIPVKDSDGETEEEENSSIETEETEEAENPDGETEEENE
jgi:CO dehydrogenase/acetyl-CoA synthase gamma subunit (corrinoid Fe-S protein)